MAEKENQPEGSSSMPMDSVRAEDVNAIGEATAPKRPALPHATLKLTRTLKVIYDMQAAGVIGRYAIGGAVGATFYLEPMPTMDVDVFVAILPEAGSLIITPTPIYDYLTARGYTRLVRL